MLFCKGFYGAGPDTVTGVFRDRKSVRKEANLSGIGIGKLCRDYARSGFAERIKEGMRWKKPAGEKNDSTIQKEMDGAVSNSNG